MSYSVHTLSAIILILLLLLTIITVKRDKREKRRIKYYLPYNARLLFYNSLVLPILDYADLVWGDKDNASLMKELKILQNKAAKLILDRSRMH